MAKSLKFIIEALLFASDKPLTVKDIRGCLPEASVGDIRGALKVLRYEYEAMGRSFTLKEVADGYQLRTHSEYGSYILKMLQTSPNRLSRAAMETLSIIAYKQPILRQDIEKFRGVDVGGILKTLLEKGLVRIMGRKDLPGRPLIYGTTKKFLEVFDLKDLKSLPKLKEIKDLGVDEFDPETPEQLFLKEIVTLSEETQDDPEQADPEEVVSDESDVNADEASTPPEDTAEAFSRETGADEAEESDEGPESGGPEESPEDVYGEQLPEEIGSPAESNEEGSDETESEAPSVRQDAGEEVSYDIDNYEIQKTTPENPEEEVLPADERSREESPELDTSRGDSESEVF